MLILFILARIICSISADRSDTVSVSDLIINASETPWQYTEGYEMTEDEMMVENKLVLARWGVTDFTSLSKRSPRADAVCVALNGKLFYDFYAYKFRSARCTYPGRSPLFAVKCGTWKRNAVILPSRPETDTINLGRCPNYTICHSDRGDNVWGATNVDDVGCSYLGTFKQIKIELKKNAKTAWCSVKQRIQAQKAKAMIHDAGQEILEDGPPAEGHQAHELQASRMYIEVEGEKGVQFGLKGKSWKTSARLYNLPFGPHPKSEEMDVRFCADFGTVAEMGGKSEITMFVYTDSISWTHPRDEVN